MPSDLESLKREISRSIHGDSDAEFQLDGIIIDKAIQKLKSENLDGDKGRCSNLVINSPTSWRLWLKALIECMIMHGHYARELLLLTLCSLPKTKVGDVCNSENYRGIAFTSCVNKVLDWVILIRYGRNFKTSYGSNLQFVYKEHQSRWFGRKTRNMQNAAYAQSMCIFLARLTIVQFYPCLMTLGVIPLLEKTLQTNFWMLWLKN